MNINTFIFDLGGVIINLNEQATISAFSKMSSLSEQEIVQKVAQSPIFQQYEKGLIDDDDFRNEVRSLFKVDISDDQIDIAWNAMLGEIPKERLDLLLALKDKFKVMILSNTNAIHIRAFNLILQQTSGIETLDGFADHVFFSHDLNMRKPDTEIYEEILKRSATKASNALFLDDKLENLAGAEEVGIQTKHIANPQQMLELKEYV